MSAASAQQLDLPLQPNPDSATRSDFEFGGRLLFFVLLLGALISVYQLRSEALERAQTPFIADGVEYLTMARHLVDGTPLSVKPVRAGLFPVLLAIPLALERAWMGPPSLTAGGIEDPSSAMWVLHLFNLFAIYGAYRLGRVLRGPLTGLLAAFFTATLPLFTQWSLGYLTDVPAATFGVWALVYFAERKPFRVGLMLGLAVLMRYQCLIPLGAFFVVPLLLRNWRMLGWMSLGLLPSVLILGVVDYVFWGEAFHSFLLFVPRQLTTFLPAGIVAKFLPLADAPVLPTVPMNLELESVAAKSRDWYFEKLPTTMTKVLGYLLLLYPLSRRSMRTRAGGDMTLWVIVTTVLVLSMQRYKESRYLVAIVPLVAALSASSVLWGVTLVVKRVSLLPRLGTVVGAAMLGWLGFHFSQLGAWLQEETHLAPFGAHLDAVEAIPRSARPCTLGLDRPWLLLKDHPLQELGARYWLSKEFSSFELALADQFFELSPDAWENMQGRGPLYELDYLVIPLPTNTWEWARLRWMNEHFQFDGYFYDPRDNDMGCLLLRSTGSAKAEKPFWELEDPSLAGPEKLGEFRGGVQLLSVEAKAFSTGRNGYKIDTRWRLPELAHKTVAATVVITNAQDYWLGTFTTILVHDDAYERKVRSGAVVRDTQYIHLRGDRGIQELKVNVNVSVVLMDEESGASSEPLGSAVFDLHVPVTPYQPVTEPEPLAARWVQPNG